MTQTSGYLKPTRTSKYLSFKIKIQILILLQKNSAYFEFLELFTSLLFFTVIWVPCCLSIQQNSHHFSCSSLYLILLFQTAGSQLKRQGKPYWTGPPSLAGPFYCVKNLSIKFTPELRSLWFENRAALQGEGRTISSAHKTVGHICRQ